MGFNDSHEAALVGFNSAISFRLRYGPSVAFHAQAIMGPYGFLDFGSGVETRRTRTTSRAADGDDAERVAISSYVSASISLAANGSHSKATRPS